jgi:hypothetical protein
MFSLRRTLPRGKIDGGPHPVDAAERPVLGQTVPGIEHHVLAVVQRCLGMAMLPSGTILSSEWFMPKIQQQIAQELGVREKQVVSVKISACSDARDRNTPISADQIKLQTSLINQQHRPIRPHWLAGLSRQ